MAVPLARTVARMYVVLAVVVVVMVEEGKEDEDEEALMVRRSNATDVLAPETMGGDTAMISTPHDEDEEEVGPVSLLLERYSPRLTTRSAVVYFLSIFVLHFFLGGGGVCRHQSIRVCTQNTGHLSTVPSIILFPLSRPFSVSLTRLSLQ